LGDVSIQIDEHGARFEPGPEGRSLITALAWPVAKRSRRARALVIGMPGSWLRTNLLARYYWRMLDRMQRDGFLPPVRADAELKMFGIGTYSGPEGWQSGMRNWFAAFRATRIELREFIEAYDGEFVLVIHAFRDGDNDEIGALPEVGLVVRVEGGEGVEGRLYGTKEDALEAAGL
jgi:hypothetical protein